MTEVTDKPESHWLDPPRWWRRAKPVRWIIIAVVLIWLVSAFDLMRFVKLPAGAVPSFLKAAPHPETANYTKVAVGVPIADRFKSYQDVQSVTAALSNAGFEGWTTASRRAVASSSYPPYNFDTITVREYQHLNATGTLSLQFFNNRLFQAEFVPKDSEDYARKLRSLGLERDRNARLEKIEGDLRMASTVELAISTVGKQLRTQPFVLWQDLRLIRERDQWDEKFGSIPKQIDGG